MNMKHVLHFVVGWPILVCAGALWLGNPVNVEQAIAAMVGGFAGMGWLLIAERLDL